MGISNLSVIKFDILDFKTEHAKTIPYNNNLTIKTQITNSHLYKSNNIKIGTIGFVIHSRVVYMRVSTWIMFCTNIMSRISSRLIIMSS